MSTIIAFDLSGRYAHFKKIYATTTALSYPIPPKTSLYGLIGGILGLEKEENRYLAQFEPGSCKIGIQILEPLVFQRLAMNLRAVFGPMKENDNRKPTSMEFVYRPKYRVFVSHRDKAFMNELRDKLIAGQAAYTPTLGLANLIAKLKWVGEWQVEEKQVSDLVYIHSVIPKDNFIGLASESAPYQENHLIEIGQYAVEMDQFRNVTERDDIILDRKGLPVLAQVSSFFTLTINGENSNIILF